VHSSGSSTGAPGTKLLPSSHPSSWTVQPGALGFIGSSSIELSLLRSEHPLRIGEGAWLRKWGSTKSVRRWEKARLVKGCQVYRDWRDAGGEASRAALLHTTYGTPNYEAPEVLEDKGYDRKMANSLRATRILAGVLPFDEPTMSAL
jgi:hypothetical protein